MNSGLQPRVIKFGLFEVDLCSGELRKSGARVALQEQPFRILVALLEHPGAIVSRDDLQRHLWPDGTFVDFEHSLNAAIRRLRTALNDDAAGPRFVETMHRRGYRFVAPVNGRPMEDQTVARHGVVDPRHVEGRAKLAVLPFAKLGDSARQDIFTEGLTEETIAQLARRCTPTVGVVARTSVRFLQLSVKSAAEIGRALNAKYLLEGSVRTAGERVRITSQLIDVTDETHLWADVYDRGIGDCLTLQTEIALLIAQAVATRLS
jgi:TolB-like protein